MTSTEEKENGKAGNCTLIGICSVTEFCNLSDNQICVLKQRNSFFLFFHMPPFLEYIVCIIIFKNGASQLAACLSRLFHFPLFFYTFSVLVWRMSAGNSATFENIGHDEYPFLWKLNMW